jgi:hypothetical protein
MIDLTKEKIHTSLSEATHMTVNTSNGNKTSGWGAAGLACGIKQQPTSLVARATMPHNSEQSKWLKSIKQQLKKFFELTENAPIEARERMSWLPTVLLIEYYQLTGKHYIFRSSYCKASRKQEAAVLQTNCPALPCRPCHLSQAHRLPETGFLTRSSSSAFK